MYGHKIVAYLLHARKVEPQNQPFLNNTHTNNGTAGLRNPFLGYGSVNTLPRRRMTSHSNSNGWESCDLSSAWYSWRSNRTGFSVRGRYEGYITRLWYNPACPRWGSTASLTDWLTVSRNMTLTKRFPYGSGAEYLHTVALRVVLGDKKGSLECETVKYGRESHWTRTWERMRWRGPAAIVNDRPILSWEKMLYKVYDRRFSIEKNFLPWVSRGSAPRRTDWRSTANRKVTLTLTVSLPDDESWVDCWDSEWLRIRLRGRTISEASRKRGLQVLAFGRLYFMLYWLSVTIIVRMKEL
jgi:hypothetical protein